MSSPDTINQGPARGRGGHGGMRGGGQAELTVFSQKVRQIEDQVEANLKQARKRVRLPARPGYGTQGREVILWANYFELISTGNSPLHRYKIDVLPGQNGKKPTGKKLGRIVELLIEENFAQYGPGIVTDFKSTLISTNLLNIGPGAYQVVYRTEGEDQSQPNRIRYRMRVVHDGSMTVADLLGFLTSPNAEVSLLSKDAIIQALNIVVGHYPKQSMSTASIGPNKHYDLAAASSEKTGLGAGLTAIRGFFLSARAATGRILTHIQVKHGAFYDHGPLETVMTAHATANGFNKYKLESFLKKISVHTTHMVRTNNAGRQIPRLKTISGLARRGDGLNEGQGRYISVFDFFVEKHNITINNTNIPVVNVDSEQGPVYLLAQVCQVIPGQAARCALSPSQTQQMIRFAVRKHRPNAITITTSGAQMLALHNQGSNNPNLKAFNVHIIPKLIAVTGRVLNSPKVLYDAGKQANTAFGSWNMKEVRFTAKTSLATWTYLLITSPSTNDPWNSPAELKQSLDALKSKLSEVGVVRPDCRPGLRISVDVNAEGFETRIDEALSKFAAHPNRPRLVFAILPSTDSHIYNRVKYVCDVKEGLLNVCVIASKFKRANGQYRANVALKFNLKLGGCNQSLQPPKLGILSDGKTMVVGLDVTHPSPGSLSMAPSVVGIVASINESFGQWPADLSIQTGRQEMVAGLKSLMKGRLKLWSKHNHDDYSKNILLYRDGVSEGQYNLVLDQELPEIRAACRDLYPPKMTGQGLPRISWQATQYTFLPDQARTSGSLHKYFQRDRGRSWRHPGPPLGLLPPSARYSPRNSETGALLHRLRRDLPGRKCATTFKNVADVLEDLTHNLCYLFGRATKAVSICPPAYCVDLVCERARCYLGKIFNPSSMTSSTGSVAGVDASLVNIHPIVRDSMFYI
ncbi:uncharacterized protein Z518_06837 [Rhinocladiella mackenziei CBS 650.93]|uniref:Piwi domain-containing protein n=1 Tax=Rhinocladiella mackenziei CBS 650.93 TaxID=1442369 RepID=A0A0D2J2T8_9EURO|nr:uncharacterized protein Z518_06837 [Rhinocladiella mackenziei CBS 650.93]KIX03285.1 hypothetical protein Z518_06837 [Rhinocladiella mackenziei CBS 650.93]